MKRDGSLPAFVETDTLCKYAKGPTGWHEESSEELPAFDVSSARALRSQVAGLAARLDNRLPVAGGEISGIAYAVFDRSGFQVFSIEELSSRVFDGIMEDIQTPVDAFEIPSPIPGENAGEYYFDLDSLQLEHPEITSKAALKSWMENTAFRLLRLRCKHTPPWILSSGTYSVIEAEQAGSILAEVRPI